MDNETTSAATAGVPSGGVDYNAEGVDLTLIRWFLQLSVDERFQELQRGADSLGVLDAAASADR